MEAAEHTTHRFPLVVVVSSCLFGFFWWFSLMIVEKTLSPFPLDCSWPVFLHITETEYKTHRQAIPQFGLLPSSLSLL